MKRAAMILTALILAGCAETKLVAPNPGAVHSSLSRAGSGVTKAEAQRSEIARKNAEALAALQRADNKDVVIEAYRKWQRENRR